MSTRRPRLAVLLLGLAAVAPGFAAAAVRTVTDCGDTTPGGAPGQLRRLITDADPGDTIEVPGCVITLSGASGEDANAGGDLDVDQDLTIRGVGGRRTVIDGGAVDRVFDVFAPATVTIEHLMVRNGRGLGFGGGLRNAGTLTLTRVVVRGNQAVPAICADTAGGGGIDTNGTLTVVESSIEGNVAAGCLFGLAGGILNNSGTLTLTRSTLRGNSGVGVNSSTGAITNGGTLNLVDSTVSGNDGGENGPGGILSPGTLSAIGSAIVNNRSAQAEANGVNASGPATLTNTIVAGNFNDFPSSSQCEGTTSLGGNLATDGTCALVGPGDTVAADAGLGPLSDHGGPTSTHSLRAGSPAIDGALAGPCGPTDQRGTSRPQDGDGDASAVCDKGPFELTPPIFADMAAEHIARGAAEALRLNGVTGGCQPAPLAFCPDGAATRGQIAVFLLRSLEGQGFTPPGATGVFADVPANHPFAPWIEELFDRGIARGCGTAPPRFCPDAAVTRGQLAVLLLRTLSIPGFAPPPATGVFADVPTADPFAPWIEEIFRRGITSGCRSTPDYCPDVPITRAQIALFLVRAFGLGF